MIDEQTLTDALRQARTADVVRVPPLARIVGRAEYAKEMQRRRRFTILVAVVSALAVACASAVILLAPRAFPLSLSPGILPLLALSAAAALWGMDGEVMERGPLVRSRRT
jgi:hypothetical protein